MKGIPQGRYTKEFREEAGKLVTEGNMTIPTAARRLSVPPSTVGNWLRARQSGKLAEIGQCQKPLTEIEMEVVRTTRDLGAGKMERDSLKKAAAYVANESRPGTQ